MHVVAKYIEGAGQPPFMDLFKQASCSIDLTLEGYVCHKRLPYEEFINWYNNNNMTQHPWTDTDTVLLTNSLVLVGGRVAKVDEQLSIYIAEDDGIITDTEAKACGLWDKILDQLYMQRPQS